MRWFKHLSYAHNDECMSELLKEFGAEGYGVWWIILKKIEELSKRKGDYQLSYSIKKWASICHVSRPKFIKIATLLNTLKIIEGDIGTKRVFISIPGTAKIYVLRPNQRCSAEYKQWRSDIYCRDLYTCQKCNAMGVRLNAHHIKPYAKFPDLRLELANRITLCEVCHKEEHKGVKKYYTNE